MEPFYCLCIYLSHLKIFNIPLFWRVPQISSQEVGRVVVGTPSGNHSVGSHRSVLGSSDVRLLRPSSACCHYDHLNVIWRSPGMLLMVFRGPSSARDVTKIFAPTRHVHLSSLWSHLLFSKHFKIASILQPIRYWTF